MQLFEIDAMRILRSKLFDGACGSGAVHFHSGQHLFLGDQGRDKHQECQEYLCGEIGSPTALIVPQQGGRCAQKGHSASDSHAMQSFNASPNDDPGFVSILEIVEGYGCDYEGEEDDSSYPDDDGEQTQRAQQEAHRCLGYTGGS